MANGLFVGLITLDCIYQVDHVPASNEKLVAHEALWLAGGPATNAAVTFRYLDHEATIIGALGQHPLNRLIEAELSAQKVTIVPLLSNTELPAPLSTILVTAATGDRAVVSRNAVGLQADLASISSRCLEGIDIVLVDGHQMAVGLQIATWARQKGIPVVVDAGSWKPGFDQILPLATTVIAASKFRLPECPTADTTLSALVALEIPEVAMTQGEQPIRFHWQDRWQEMAVPTTAVVDTLGAGDIFHGAFCHFRLHYPFAEALAKASAVASWSCRFFGPRKWMNHWPDRA